RADDERRVRHRVADDGHSARARHERRHPPVPVLAASGRPVRRRAADGMTMRSARGVAFVLVLWVIALMSILLGAFAVIARTENLQARHLFDSTAARYAAEAGLNRAVYELRNPDLLTRWMGDGRPYTFDFEGIEVEVKVTDDSGKIDLNVADAIML